MSCLASQTLFVTSGTSDGAIGGEREEIKTAANYVHVPSGTFVKAIMPGGADVAAGAMSQSDPSPNKLL
jgi:hypothetical protein